MNKDKTVKRAVEDGSGATVTAGATNVPQLDEIRLLRGGSLAVLVQFHFDITPDSPGCVGQRTVVAHQMDSRRLPHTRVSNDEYFHFVDSRQCAVAFSHLVG